MRTFQFPACYATEVATTLERLRASIANDEILSDGEAPFDRGFIAKDADRAGSILVVVGDLPADNSAPIFPSLGRVL